MTHDPTDRAQNMMLGALVADAAALGLHWIYDQDHIAKVAPQDPAFVAPDAANYKNVPAYFAHAQRSLGQQSQYGEQLIVMQNALAANGGTYDPATYIAQFQTHFGYGGAYVGYIDHATGDSLDAFRRAKEAALERGRAVPFDGDAKTTTAMVGKALALVPRYQDDALRTKFEEAVRMTHDDDAIVAYGFKVLDQIVAMPPVYGAVDVQLPAIAKLPPLVAALADADDEAFNTAITSAIRITSNHDTSVAFGLASARLMRAALKTQDVTAIIKAGCDGTAPEVQALLDEAHTMTAQNTNDVTRHFGMACDLSYGVPNVVHNIATAPSFAEGISRNIYAGGDSCGRAILLGAVLGAVYGVGGEQGIPQTWIGKLTH